MPAGGFKTFVAGEILTAADTNAFLMQGILVFDDDTARDAAITSPVEGQFAFLKDTDTVFFYDGSAWVELESGIPIEYVVVAGGGGGGQNRAGGGGAGGYNAAVVGEKTGADSTIGFAPRVEAGTYPITVGAGGATANPGALGGNSLFVDVFSLGGGGGNGNATAATSGGSGGGGGPQNTAIGLGFPRQGRNGGSPNGGQAAGGGGGAEAVGVNAPTTTAAGNGGAGISSSITGTAVARGGGGGGGKDQNSGTRGLGGTGGGGNGQRGTDTAGTAGGANTGGGGGGGGGISGSANGTGQAGGSGVVIFKLPKNVTVSFSGGVTSSSVVGTTHTVYTVTAAGPTDTVTIG
jgi:hypothetical protein